MSSSARNRWRSRICFPPAPPSSTFKRNDSQHEEARALQEGGEDLVGGPDSLGAPAFHEALEVQRAVLAGEVDVALRRSFVAPEGCILSHAAVGGGAPVHLRDDRVRLVPVFGRALDPLARDA